MTSKQILGFIAGLVFVVGGTVALFFLSNDKQPVTARTPVEKASTATAAKQADQARDASQPAQPATAAEEQAKTAMTHTHADGQEHDHEHPHAESDQAETASTDTDETTSPAASATIDNQLTEADELPEPIHISGDGNQVTLSLDETLQADMATKYDKAVIQITGPENFSQKQELVSTSAMTITDELPDGIYKWEAVTVPKIPDSVRQELSAVRQSGNSEKMNEMIVKYREQGLFPTEDEIRNNRKSGSFRIHEGSIVDNIEEE